MITSRSRWMRTRVSTETLIENGARHFINYLQLGALSSNHLVMRHGNLLSDSEPWSMKRDRIMIGAAKGVDV